MPITIIPTQPANVFTPGGFISWSSDFIGPLPSGSTFDVRWWADSEETALLYSQTIPTQVTGGALNLLTEVGAGTNIGERLPAEGASTAIRVTLQDPAHVTLDTGVQLAPFSSTVGLGMQQALQQQTTTQGGFTETDRELLNQVAALTQQTLEGLTVDLTAVGNAVATTVGALLSPIKLDFGHDSSLSGGVTCDPLRIDLSLAAFYGIKVHVTEFPDTWRFGTPDGDWGFHDLAVLSCWIDQDQLIRCGIHTTSFTLSPLPGTIVPFIAQGVASIQPPGYSVHVDWAPGVCGEVIGINWPV